MSDVIDSQNDPYFKPCRICYSPGATYSSKHGMMMRLMDKGWSIGTITDMNIFELETALEQPQDLFS